MSRKVLYVVAIAALLTQISVPVAAQDSTARSFPVSSGQLLTLDLRAGGSVRVVGDGGSEVSVAYSMSGTTADNCRVETEADGKGVTIRSRFNSRDEQRSSSIDIEVHVPRYFDVELDSMGGGLELEGVEGEFRGKTMGGSLTLKDVGGEARLKTMGGSITLLDSELDGELHTMGGEVLFENVTGDVSGSSMGGNVRYKNVYRRDGSIGTLERLGDVEVTEETVQISTMGGRIKVEQAPEGAALHTMGGDIRVTDARQFVSAKTMGGDILLDAVDGWVKATTMGGDIEVTLVGSGGDARLQSMSGDIVLVVPPGFSMELELEIAFTRSSSQDYRIIADYDLERSVTPDWEHDNSSPRKYIRARGGTGGENRLQLRTVNGNIEVRTGS